MRWPLLFKVSFWLVIIGLAALITPNPAWPEWFSRMVLSAGVALGVTSAGVLVWQSWRKRSRRPGSNSGN